MSGMHLPTRTEIGQAFTDFEARLERLTRVRAEIAEQRDAITEDVARTLRRLDLFRIKQSLERAAETT